VSLGPVMVGLSGQTLTEEERDMLLHPMVGAVILFSRNYDNPQQLQELISEIHLLRDPHLLVSVDHEGGRVQRFREGFTHLPPMRRLGEIFDDEPKRARRLAETVGWLMAVELRAVGVDFSFAPVLDLDYGVSEIIGDRSFHRQPQAVADLAQSFIGGMQRAGMSATGKHFPGHGAVEVDTHVGIARDERPLVDLELADLIPFERLIKAGLAGVMPGHVIYPQVDSQPAGFSRFWLQEMLRQRLGFQGVIFSDDLLMEGASIMGSVSDRAEAALAAGCDMVLVCDNFTEICNTLERLERFDNPASHLRLARMHGRHPLSRDQLHNDPHWHQALHAIEPLLQAKPLDLL
jgi:beta-N-acetylhexosaminidase